jgi:hypothetical protein
MMFATLTAAAALASPLVHVQTTKSELSLCNPCVSLGSQGLNILLNEILNVGVIGGCGKLCHPLKAGIERTGCDVLCAAVGIKTFIKALNKTDLDPIYFCEELKACPAGHDDAAGTVDGNAVSPAIATQGTAVQMQLQFSVINATGVGEIRVAVKGEHAGDPSVGQSFINTGFAPGHYATNISLTVQDDPSAQPPVRWTPGTYTYAFEVCQGECGSKHPHSKVFGSTQGTFQVQ